MTKPYRIDSVISNVSSIPEGLKCLTGVEKMRWSDEKKIAGGWNLGNSLEATGGRETAGKSATTKP